MNVYNLMFWKKKTLVNWQKLPSSKIRVGWKGKQAQGPPKYAPCLWPSVRWLQLITGHQSIHLSVCLSHAVMCLNNGLMQYKRWADAI